GVSMSWGTKNAPPLVSSRIGLLFFSCGSRTIRSPDERSDIRVWTASKGWDVGRSRMSLRSPGLRTRFGHPIIHADALHDHEFTGPVVLAVHIMWSLRTDRAALAGLEHKSRVGRARLHHHGPFHAEEAVGHFRMRMPRHALARCEGEDADAHV